MKIGIMQPYFFPYLGYFQLIHSVDKYVNLDHVSFMKRSYMTRNTIKDDILNVNVYGGSQNKKCNEIFVNFENNYNKKLFSKLHHLYSKSKYYEQTISFIKPFFEEREITISEFNINIIKSICYLLEIKTEIINTSSGYTTLKKGEGLKEITKILGGDEYVNAIGGQSLYNKEDFKNSNIDLYFIQMCVISIDNRYSSIMDILFNYPVEHIKEQITKYKLI